MFHRTVSDILQDVPHDVRNARSFKCADCLSNCTLSTTPCSWNGRAGDFERLDA